MPEISETIERANYVATEQQVEQLAGSVQGGRRADGCYLRVLVVAVQAALGTGRRGRRQALPPQEPVLDAAHEKFYPAVMRGVGGDEIDTPERNRRATFARSAKSTLRYFITHGGDIRTLNAAEVTKQGLRNAVRPPREAAGSRDERIVVNAQEMMLRAIQRMAKGAPELARQRLEAAMDSFEQTLEALAEPEQAQADAEHGTTQVGGATTTIVGRQHVPTGTSDRAPMLHRGA
jgi:hypothetical protein